MTVQGLGKQISSGYLIQNPDFVLEESETLCLSAPSGSGKTTALRVALPLYSPFLSRVSYETARLTTTSVSLNWPLTKAESHSLARLRQRWESLSSVRGSNMSRRELESCPELHQSSGPFVNSHAARLGRLDTEEDPVDIGKAWNLPQRSMPTNFPLAPFESGSD